MADITKTCTVSGKSFIITDEDQAFYEKIGTPMPTLCPEERLRRRLSFRNERNLYKRQCDLCQKVIVSMYDKDVPFPVYCSTCWWSDKWDPKSYGRDIDFNRPFFEQFEELKNVVPKSCVLSMNNENSDFNSLLAFSKNTYMSPGSHLLEDCQYLRKSQYCTDCSNSDALDHCELVSYSSNCNGCYSSHHLSNCRNCSNSSYLSDCSSCKDCFMCSGLRGKQYFFKNKQYSKEEYEKILENYAGQSSNQLEEEFAAFEQSVPKVDQKQLNTENSTGDFLTNSKNAIECFDCFNAEDSKYLLNCAEVKDCMDMSMHDKEIELCYEMSTGGEKNYRNKFCYCGCASPNSEYLFSTFYLSNSFGCDGFHSRTKNCILNKQYSEEEYEALRAKLIEHMKETGEYGEFFPISMSSFPYNDSMAQDFFPMTKEEALGRGYKWKDKDEDSSSTAVEAQHCENCSKAFRIIQQETDLNKKMHLEGPKLCPECRYQKLRSRRNGMKLWDRSCGKCGTAIKTSYSPEQPETVYCKSCYLAEVY